MCILLYVKLIWGSGVPEIYGHLEQGGYICPRYMCTLLYVKPMRCSGVPEIYGQLEEGEHLISVCTSSENMSSFQVWVLHHRGLFYERPIRVYRHQEICEEEYNFVDREEVYVNFAERGSGSTQVFNLEYIVKDLNKL